MRGLCSVGFVLGVKFHCKKLMPVGHWLKLFALGKLGSEVHTYKPR